MSNKNPYNYILHVMVHIFIYTRVLAKKNVLKQKNKINSFD